MCKQVKWKSKLTWILCIVSLFFVVMEKGVYAHDTGEVIKSGTTEDGIGYDVIDDSIEDTYVNIIGYTGSALEVTIPETIEGFPVYYIGEEAFANQTQLEKVTIASSVRQMQARAFKNCTSLKSVILPSTLWTFDSSSFQGCSSLEEFLVSGEDGQLGSIDGVLYGMDNEGNPAMLVAYPGGKKDSSYTVPVSVVLIFSESSGYGDVFYGNQYLEQILVEEDETFTREEGAIKILGSNYYLFDRPSTFVSVDGVLFNGEETLVSYPSGKKDETYVIPDTVTSIKGWAICENEHLRTLTIPDSVTVFANSGQSIHDWKETPSYMDSVSQCFGVDSNGRPLPNFMVQCSEDSEAYGYIRCKCPYEIECKADYYEEYEQFVGVIYYRTNVNGVIVDVPEFLEDGFEERMEQQINERLEAERADEEEKENPEDNNSSDIVYEVSFIDKVKEKANVILYSLLKTICLNMIFLYVRTKKYRILIDVAILIFLFVKGEIRVGKKS